MPHRIVITRRAEGDLEAIGDYIARDNPRAAYDLIDRIQTSIADLAQFPARFQLRPQLGAGYRVCVVGAYVIP